MAFDKWFFDLYERNYALLYRVGRVFLAYDPVQESFIEDQIQETFIRAWQKRSILKHHPNPDGWVVESFRKCLTNACRKRNREWKHRVYFPDSEKPAETIDLVHLSPDEYVKSKEQIDLLFRLLGKEDAELFLRYCIYGEKAASIAAEMNVSEQALRMRISRLKKKILKNRDLFACLVLLCLLGLQ